MDLIVRFCIMILAYTFINNRVHVRCFKMVDLPEAILKTSGKEAFNTLRNYAGITTNVNTLHTLFHSRFGSMGQSLDSLDRKLADYISDEFNKDLYKEIDFHDVHRTFHDVITIQQNDTTRIAPRNVTMVMKETHAFLYSFLLYMNNISRDCSTDIGVVVLNVMNRKLWAIKILDSMGHLESGVFDGNIQLLGNHEECAKVTAVVDGREMFHGTYCALHLPRFYLPTVGMCVPSSCSRQDVERLYLNVILENNKAPNTVSCVEDNPLPTEAVVCICVLVVLVGLVVAGTVYDLIIIQQCLGHVGVAQCCYHNNPQPKTTPPISIPNPLYDQQVGNGEEPETKNEVVKATYVTESPAKQEVDVKRGCHGCSKGKLVDLLLSFSAYTNLKPMFVVKDDDNPFKAVYGIRFLSIAWIVLGHLIFYTFLKADNSLSYLGRDKLNSFSFMVVPHSSFAVSAFFTLSGALVSYRTLSALQQTGGARHFNWLMFYIHRYIRLTPVYALVLMVAVCLIGTTLEGPMSEMSFLNLNGCRKVWWRNLLYIDTFFEADRKCLGYTWYLSADMQMYWISPLMIIPLYYHGVVGTVVCCAMFLTTTIASGVHAYHLGYSAQSSNSFTMANREQWNLLYTSFFMRMGPYIVGVMTGFLLYKTQLKINISKIVNIVCWIVCIGISTTVVYVTYKNDSKNIFTPEQSAAYWALGRSAFGVSVAWIVFACATNHGGWINSLLSWKLFSPLARLTYGIYLVHPIILVVYLASRMSEIHYTTYEVVYMFIGNLLLSIFTALVTYILIEVPTGKIEKALLF